MVSIEEAKQLFDNNQGLAIHAVYSKYARLSPHDVEDLLQEAKIALWQAAVTYDESRGVKFSSYALPYIIAAVASAARDSFNTAVYYPKSIKTLASKLMKHYGTLEAIVKSPSLYDDFSQYTRSSIEGAVQFLRGPLSLSASTNDGDDFDLLEICVDASSRCDFENIEGQSIVDTIFSKLSQEEAGILSALMNDDAEFLASLSQQKIIRVKHKALKLYQATTGDQL